MTEDAAASRTQEGRECGCPEWTEQCVHWDGVILSLLSVEKADGFGCRTCRQHWESPLFVINYIDEWERCYSCKTPAIYQRNILRSGQRFTTKDAALAAFRDAEARLLEAQ